MEIAYLANAPFNVRHVTIPLLNVHHVEKLEYQFQNVIALNFTLKIHYQKFANLVLINVLFVVHKLIV